MDFTAGYPNLFITETLESLTQWAHSQPRNVEHFIERVTYPPTGVFVKIDDDDKVHTRVVFVDKFTENDGLKMSYEWYIQMYNFSGVTVKRLEKKNWLKTHNNIYPKVNEAIRNHHGIQCFLKGTTDIENPINNVILHWCDVLVICMRQEMGMDPPQVLIKSRNLQEISNDMANSFFPNEHSLVEAFVDENEKRFIFINADYYYHMFGLWGNFSNKPIRIANNDVIGLSRSNEFCNDANFKKHQIGKYNALKRRVHHPIAKSFYICHE